MNKIFSDCAYRLAKMNSYYMHIFPTTMALQACMKRREGLAGRPGELLSLPEGGTRKSSGKADGVTITE
ncbi:unnamed protein product [Caretta caretta]